MSKNLDDLETTLTTAKLNTENRLAEITGIRVTKAKFADVSPATGSRYDEGLVIEFDRAAGTRSQWFETPETWDPQCDLVRLLNYFGLDPTADDFTLRDLEGEAIPVHWSDRRGWEVDWSVIEATGLPETLE